MTLRNRSTGADWLAMSSNWSMRSTSGTSWTASVNFASCCNIFIGSASSVRGTASPIQLAVLGPHVLAPQPHQCPAADLRLGPFQVQHHPEQLEVAVPEARGRLQPVGVIVGQARRVAVAFAVAECVHLGPGQPRHRLQERRRQPGEPGARRAVRFVWLLQPVDQVGQHVASVIARLGTSSGGNRSSPGPVRGRVSEMPASGASCRCPPRRAAPGPPRTAAAGCGRRGSGGARTPRGPRRESSPHHTGRPSRWRSAWRPSGTLPGSRARGRRPCAGRRRPRIRRERRRCSWAVPFQKDKVKRRVQIHSLGVGHQLRVHRLNEVGAAQVQQVLRVRLDQSLFELRQGKAREVRLPLACPPQGRDEHLVVVEPILGRAARPPALARSRQRRSGRTARRAVVRAVAAGGGAAQPVPHHLAPRGVGLDGRQAGLEQRELLERASPSCSRSDPMSRLKTAHKKPSSVVSSEKPSSLHATASSTWLTVEPAPAASSYFRLRMKAASLSPLSSLAAASADSPAAFGNRYLAITVDQFVRGGSSATPRNRSARSRPASVRANVFRLPFVRKPAEASSFRKSSNWAAEKSKPSNLPTSSAHSLRADGILARQGHPNQHKVGNGRVGGGRGGQSGGHGCAPSGLTVSASRMRSRIISNWGMTSSARNRGRKRSGV